MKRKIKMDDEYFEFGLASWRGSPWHFERYHRHNEVELALIENGSLTYLFGSGRITIPKGRLAVFWGAIPHQLVSFPPMTIWHLLTVPLAWFLQWQLSEELNRQILSGKVVIDPDASRALPDLYLFNQWHKDLRGKGKECRKVVLLEVEARLWRLAFAVESSRSSTKKRSQPLVKSAGGPGLGKVEQMACFIAKNYTEPLRVAEIAGIAGLHPDYATTLFRKTCGMSLMDFVTEHRVSQAQRLLATTNRKILDIAIESGFRSASRFYALFRACPQERHFSRTIDERSSGIVYRPSPH